MKVIFLSLWSHSHPFLILDFFSSRTYFYNALTNNLTIFTAKTSGFYWLIVRWCPFLLDGEEKEIKSYLEQTYVPGGRRGSSINEQFQTRYRCLPLATSTYMRCAPGAKVWFRKTDEGYDAVCLCVGCQLKTLVNACAQLEEMFGSMYRRNITSVSSNQCYFPTGFCLSHCIGERFVIRIRMLCNIRCQQTKKHEQRLESNVSVMFHILLSLEVDTTGTLKSFSIWLNPRFQYFDNHVFAVCSSLRRRERERICNVFQIERSTEYVNEAD